MAFDTLQERGSVLALDTVLPPFPTGVIESEALEILGGGYPYLTDWIEVGTGLKALFDDLLVGMLFELGGNYYTKIKSRYDSAFGIVNAIDMISGDEIYIIPQTKVNVSTKEYNSRPTLTCVPTLRTRFDNIRPELHASYDIACQFWEIPDWSRFSVDGVEYTKLRNRYNQSVGVVNAVNVATRVERYFSPDLVVLSNNNIHDLRKTPSVSQSRLINRPS